MSLMKRMTWLLVVLAIVSCLLMNSPATAVPDSYLRGYVIDSSTGQPVSGATISMTGSNLSPTSTISNGDGSYSLGRRDTGLGLKSGERIVDGNNIPRYVDLTAVKDGYLPYASSVDLRLYQVSGYNISLTPFTANFYAFGHVGQAPYSVRFMDQSTGSPTAWFWDFGDGSNSTEQNPTHVFTKNGVYNVALTATYDWGSNTCTQYRCIIVNSVPVAAFTANATSGRTPFTVQFTDQSSDANGYQWQFGDGTTSTEQNPIHTYTSPGTYTVMLTVSVPDYGSVFIQKPGYITVTEPSSVDFAANVTAGLSPLAVHFNESVNGSVQYFFWQFGDGSTSSESNPVHVYETAGRYTVSLMTVGSNGTEVKTIEDYINVTSPVTPTVTPTATATATATVTPTGALPVANFTVTSSDQDSLGIQVADTSENATSVRYDLGDGTTTAYRTFRYTYWQAGTYTIDQTATNAAGSSHKSFAVTVPATTFPPVGGDQGWYTVHCNVDGASVLFDQTPMGTIAGGILKVKVYTTATPYYTYTVSKDGYATFQGTITTHPGKDQNVDLTAQLIPIAGQVYNGPHTIPGTLQAEDYNIGGEGVTYHDTTVGNEGGAYRQDDVDIEVLDTDGSPNVGWIRAGEWLTYTVNVSTAGTYDAGFRVASTHSGSSVLVYVDNGTTPVATLNVPNTGAWPVFQTISVPVTLPAGQHQFVLKFPTDFVNINWIRFALRG
ncbi:PKD domain-containing protein [Methanosphaerula palustris]|uniref:Carbohydrate binding family 6 n=1 Tax=Methanosphaerula palustris (strain ATCC BAA-1556 / DSM 19958 / E1-9c) TaxID=521011 RepID=B8GI55_METPE|nr:PKD domain-containing protein [Methanosphaerula palustris]ACL16795.1 Carbohydrate binding family 6 [Methanosphaerula palustris E1-9c]